MEKYAVMKEVEINGKRFVVPSNATETDIAKEASKQGIEMTKVASWKEIADDGKESEHVRSERSE